MKMRWRNTPPQISVGNEHIIRPTNRFGMDTWKDFEIFLQDRCLPASRAGIKEILRDMGVPFYDPLLIIEKTEGRIAGDHQWMQLIKRPAV